MSSGNVIVVLDIIFLGENIVINVKNPKIITKNLTIFNKITGIIKDKEYNKYQN